MLDLTKYSDLLTRTHGANSVSNRYKAISTQQVIDHFMAKGFTPTRIDVARANKEEHVGFQKHIVKFDVPREFATNWEGVTPKLYLLNSHNAKTSLQIFFGVYRMVCSNGLVVGTDLFRERIVHLGDTETNIKVALAQSIKNFDRLSASIKGWQRVVLSEAQQLELAIRMFTSRLPKDNQTEVDLVEYRIDAQELRRALRIRRDGDASADLFTVFNRIQENLIERPTTSYTRLVTDKQWRITVPQKRRFKALKGIAKVHANQKVWSVAEKFYQEVI